jgi:CheY-like chemotaxis protein
VTGGFSPKTEEELLGLFAVEGRRRLADLEARLLPESPDYRSLAKQAHTLRGSAAVVGLAEIAEGLGELERELSLAASGVAGVDRDEAARLLARIRDLVSALPVPERSPLPQPAKVAEGAQLVLYVEDSSANARFVEHVLGADPGLEVVGAETGDEGCRLALERRPALILLDLNLADMDGADVVGRLRQRSETHDVPVVVLTGGADEERLEELASLGVQEILLKPYTPERLLQAVSAALGR